MTERRQPPRRTPRRDDRPEEQRREPYVKPRVEIVEISSQEALMGICKQGGTPCVQFVGAGS